MDGLSFTKTLIVNVWFIISLMSLSPYISYAAPSFQASSVATGFNYNGAAHQRDMGYVTLTYLPTDIITLSTDLKISRLNSNFRYDQLNYNELKSMLKVGPLEIISAPSNPAVMARFNISIDSGTQTFANMQSFVLVYKIIARNQQGEEAFLLLFYTIGAGGRCNSDSDCHPSTPICGTNSIKTCGRCDYNFYYKCPAGLSCIQGWCKPCTEAKDCLTGEICLRGTCSGCSSNTDCSEGKICSNQKCISCYTDSQCGGLNKVCKSGACVPGCNSHAECNIP